MKANKYLWHSKNAWLWIVSNTSMHWRYYVHLPFPSERSRRTRWGPLYFFFCNVYIVTLRIIGILFNISSVKTVWPPMGAKKYQVIKLSDNRLNRLNQTYISIIFFVFFTKFSKTLFVKILFASFITYNLLFSLV